MLRLSCTGVLVAMAWAATGCEGPPPAEVRIGVITYTSGVAETCCGEWTDNVVRMVGDEMEKAGWIVAEGRRLKPVFVFRGIESGPERALTAATELINREGVSAIIGPQHSGDAIPVAELAERAGVPMISPMSTNPKTTRGRRYAFRVTFVDTEQGPALARLAFERLGARKAAILFNVTDVYSKSIADLFRTSFEGLGGRVVASEEYLAGDSDFSAHLARIAGRSPDVLLLPSHNNYVLLQGPQARRAGITATLLGTDSWNERDLEKLPEFDGAIKTTPWIRQLQTPGNREFIDRYRKSFGENPNATAALTYDGLHMLIEAVRASGDGGAAAIRDALVGMGVYEGVSGSIDYVDTGDPRRSIFALRFRGGEDEPFASDLK